MGYSQEDTIEWAPIGAEWNYHSIVELYGGVYTTVKFSSVGDSIINDNTFRIIRFDEEYTIPRVKKNELLIRQVEEKVYYLMNDSLFLLYDFSAEIGDTLVLRNPEHVFESIPSLTSSKFIIEDTFIYEIEGVSRRAQKIYSLGGSELGSVIVEGIGAIEDGWWLPTYAYIDGLATVNYLKCYSDDVVGQLTFSELPCLYSATEELSYINLRLYPNPFSDFVYVENNTNEILYFDIYNIVGKKIIHGMLDAGLNHLSMDQQGGLFYLKVRIKNGDRKGFMLVRL